MSLNTKIKDLIPYLNPQQGDVGIEIEAEASNGPAFPTAGLPAPWVATHDGSLRGISIEYVLERPLPIGEAQTSIMALQAKIKEKGTNLKYSFRAGVHVHINCQEMTLQQVMMFAAVYYSLENVLVEWCGEDRVGNLFCLRVRDAEFVLPHVGSVFRGDEHWEALSMNEIRYASLNFSALPKYGSLEFRAMATEKDFGRIAKWATMLYQLREKSKEFDSIQTLLEQFSMSSPDAWLQEILGEFYEEVRDQENIDAKVWEGVHSAQDLLFHMT